MIIGDRLRVLREQKNLSQDHIQKRTGLLRCYTTATPTSALGRRLPFETTGSLPRADSLGVSSSSWFQRGTNPNRNASHYHRS